MAASLISAVTWVPRGYAAQHPKKFTADDDELARISQLAKLRLDEANLGLEESLAKDGEDDEWEDDDDGDNDEEKAKGDQSMDEDDQDKEEGGMEVDQEKKQDKPSDPNDLSIYNLDDYDDEPSRSSAMGAFSNIKDLQHPDTIEKEDPYITLDQKEDEEQEREQLEIYPTDNLIITARTQDEISQLEVHVYDESSENLYVHHDLLLPSMPLCLEWVNFTPYSTIESDKPSTGNFIACGTMDPEIEIWNLDMVDGIFPDAVLGAPPTEQKNDSSTKKKKPTKSATTINSSYHVDAVLSLSSNRSHPNLLASASADTTVKLWDLSSSQTSGGNDGPSTISALRSFSPHGDRKVQAVQWNPTESTVLASGSWGGVVQIFDTRSPDSGVGAFVGDVDVESIKWDPWSEGRHLWVALDNGIIQAFDVRTLSSLNLSKLQPSSALWTLQAHDTSISCLDISTNVKGMVVTGSLDKNVKIWNINSPLTAGDGNEKPSINLVTSRDLGVGKVFSANFCPNDPTTLAVAGSQGSLQLWDSVANAGVRNTFKDALQQSGKDLSKGGDGIIRIAKDNEDDEEDSDEER